MDHVQFGMSPNPEGHGSAVEQSPAVGDMEFAIPSAPSVASRHQSHEVNVSRDMTLYPPMTPLIHAPQTPGGSGHRDPGPFSSGLYSHPVPSISAVIPATPGGSDNIPVPQLQN